MTLVQKLGFLLTATCGLLCHTGHAERLVTRTYSIEAGLAHNHVSRIRQDSHGLLWFCTDGGLSLWNGYQFTTYTTQDGLPHAHVDDVLETRSGAYWIATDGGLVRFHPEERLHPFSNFLPGDSSLSHSVNVLLEDADGSVLLGTGDGLYRLCESPAGVRIEPVKVPVEARKRDGSLVNSLLRTRDGELWIGTGSGLCAQGRNGTWTRFAAFTTLGKSFVNQLREDSLGRIWVGIRGGGLVVLERNKSSGQWSLGPSFTRRSGLPSDDVRDVLASKDGTVWVGTVQGIATASIADYPNFRFKIYRSMSGATDYSAYWFAESGTDLWVASSQVGATRITRGPFHTYTESDGFVRREVNQVVENGLGNICVVSGDHESRLLQCFNGQRFTSTPSGTLGNHAYGYEWKQFAVRQHSGKWLFASEEGVLEMRPSRLGTRRAKMLVRTDRRDVRHIYADSSGEVWIAEEHTAASEVAAWQPATGLERTLWRFAFLQKEKPIAPACFAEDRTGNIWIGLTGAGGLLRCRHGHVEYFDRNSGIPPGEITALYADAAGRMWAATKDNGLLEIANPSSDHLKIQRFGRTQGLTSDEIWCVTDDAQGRIYAGSGRGVDVLNPATGLMRRYTSEDGLAAGSVRDCFRDRSGQLWFVTNQGISRFLPQKEIVHPKPRAFITGIQIRGLPWAVAPSGASTLGPFELAASQNQMSIDFLGVDGRLRGDLAYQYRLKGTEQTWSRPAVSRSLSFAYLPAGAYLFEVRAQDIHGGVSPPASVRFSIQPLLWQRWWVRAAAVLALLGLLHLLQRYRLGRVIELERVRTRIASDLHDDIGSGLSQIAVLSEVAKRYAENGRSELDAALVRIGSVSRELAQSMGDIVWSINPELDTVTDLVQRMRRFCVDLFSGRDIEFRFSVSGPGQASSLATNTRREVYLIFKEALNNLVRHSACTRAEILISVETRVLRLCISDNGRGPASKEEIAGQGLINIAGRARRLGGTLNVSDGQPGMRITLDVPLT